MNNETNTAPAVAESSGTRLSTGEQFLEALARRDFAGISSCLAPDLRFRALLPPRDVDVMGREAALAEFRRWFGNESEMLELVESTVGEIGERLYLRWRVRLSTANGAAASRVVEQHAYATVGERIETLSLLCSGFVPG